MARHRSGTHFFYILILSNISSHEKFETRRRNTVFIFTEQYTYSFASPNILYCINNSHFSIFSYASTINVIKSFNGQCTEFCHLYTQVCTRGWTKMITKKFNESISVPAVVIFYCADLLQFSQIPREPEWKTKSKNVKHQSMSGTRSVNYTRKLN